MRLLRGLAAVTTAAVIGALVSSPALAHVSIDTFGDVEQGSFAKLGFSVPNERDDSTTVMVKVQMPQDHPLPFISVQPKDGWEVTTAMRTLAEPVEVFGATYEEVVDTITWTAEDGTGFGAGEFELFWISAGAMPTDVTTLAFPAIQTYASGEEVAWTQPVTEGAEEPELPTPTLTLVAAEGGAAHGDTAGDAADDVGDDDDDSVLPVIALIVGALGLITALAALLGRRTSPATPRV